MNAIPYRKAVRADLCKLTPSWYIPAFIAVAILLSPLGSRAQVTTFAGVVIENTCKAQVFEPEDQKWHVLVSPKGSHRPLIAGEILKCGSTSGSLTLLDSQTYTTISGMQTHKVEVSSVLNEVIRYAEPAFTRGESPVETIFSSPPSGGTVEPERLVVRWRPPAGIGEVTLSVAPESSDLNLFESGRFEASSAAFDSQELRDALAKYRDRNGFAPLVLRLRDAAGHEYRVSFSVLTPPNQKRLVQELAEWDAKDGLVRHLGRASVYSDFGLYSEAAAESELALKESPKSSILLQLAASAERRTGNLPRASELEGELKQMAAKVQ
ncbi:MAG: hypothetical protein WA734_00620 [Candidatus Acidiferrales bacterium]